MIEQEKTNRRQFIATVGGGIIGVLGVGMVSSTVNRLREPLPAFPTGQKNRTRKKLQPVFSEYNI